MTVKTTIICLANSRKHLHRCIAGMARSYSGEYEWIRPIGDRDGHGVSEQEISLASGAQPLPLDIIEIGLRGRTPSGHQQENYALDPDIPWRRVGRCTWEQAIGLPILPDSLWVDGFSTYKGINDRVPVDRSAGLTDSLRLVRVQLAIRVLRPYDPNDRFEVWAEFRHARQDYRLKVTDPAVEDEFRARGIGVYPLGDSILTISLSEEWKGYFYKLVAAVMLKPAV